MEVRSVPRRSELRDEVAIGKLIKIQAAAPHTGCDASDPPVLGVVVRGLDDFADNLLEAIQMFLQRAARVTVVARPTPLAYPLSSVQAI